MKKYNMKSIMSRAWEIKKSDTNFIFSLCLKMAWEESKMEKTGKELYTENLKKICDEANSYDNNYHYEMKIKDWQKGNKSRTYFSIIETHEGTKHYAKKDYGYFYNINNEYVEGYSNSLDGTLFTFSGALLK
jgi:asparagine synthetase B (glutamine-hydrolysing)